MTTERRENIARALWEAERVPSTNPQPKDRLDRLWNVMVNRDHYRRLADAAIAAGGLETRVRALAEEWGVTPSVVVRHEDAADRLRSLLDGADNGGGQ